MDNIKEEEKPESDNHKTAVEVASEAVETETKVPDNAVLRKLLVSLVTCAQASI